jgi:hypothetical protein
MKPLVSNLKLKAALPKNIRKSREREGEGEREREREREKEKEKEDGEWEGEEEEEEEERGHTSQSGRIPSDGIHNVVLESQGRRRRKSREREEKKKEKGRRRGGRKREGRGRREGIPARVVGFQLMVSATSFLRVKAVLEPKPDPARDMETEAEMRGALKMVSNAKVYGG